MIHYDVMLLAIALVAVIFCSLPGLKVKPARVT